MILMSAEQKAGHETSQFTMRMLGNFPRLQCVNECASAEIPLPGASGSRETRLAKLAGLSPRRVLQAGGIMSDQWALFCASQSVFWADATLTKKYHQ